MQYKYTKWEQFKDWASYTWNVHYDLWLAGTLLIAGLITLSTFIC